jgi:hypothetical protein
VDGATTKGDIYLPRTQLRTTRMTLEETAADAACASAAVSGSKPKNAIGAIAADLKRRHPQANSAKIVNCLLTAY